MLGFLGDLIDGFKFSEHPVRFFVLCAALLVPCVIGMAAFIYPWPEERQLAEARPETSETTKKAAAHHSTVARVTGAVEARWQGLYHPAPGHVLREGMKLDLADGLVEILYATGAKIVLEGPAKFEVKGRNSAGLELGRLVARVEGRGTRDVRRRRKQWPVVSG